MGSSKVSPTVLSAKELEGCLVVLIIYSQESLQKNQESHDVNSEYDYVEIKVDTVRQLSSTD